MPGGSLERTVSLFQQQEIMKIIRSKGKEDLYLTKHSIKKTKRNILIKQLLSNC